MIKRTRLRAVSAAFFFIRINGYSKALYKYLNYYHQCGSGLPVCPGGCGEACTWQLSVAGVDSGYTNSHYGSFNVTLQDVRDVDVKATCPVKNNCTNNGCTTPGTYTPGMERYQFKGFVNLGPTSGIPASCCNVRIYWTACCRSNSISSGAADEDFYIEAIINRCLSVSPCNNSPVFKNDPKFLIIGGDNFVGNWGAVDPDLDSLSYSFAPALKAHGVPVTYVPPFTYKRPMPWTGNATGLFPQGIHCDPINGDIMFTPPSTGGTTFTGILCIAVKQWKKIDGIPTLIGTTTRDFPVTVITSPPNNPPHLITSPPKNGNVNIPETNWFVCAGEQLCFTITAKDTDFNPPTISDTTFLRWDSALVNLGATFLPDYNSANRNLPDSLGGGPREDRYSFCWTPDESMASTTPYYFTVSAADKRCPLPGEMTRAFSILVLPKASARINQTQTSCNDILLSYTNTNPEAPIKSAYWRIAKTPDDSTFLNGFHSFTASTTPTSFQFKAAGRYYIQLLATTKGPIGSPGCTEIVNGYVDATGIQLKDSIRLTDLSCALIPTGKLELKGYNGVAPYQYKLNNQPYTSSSIFTNLIAGPYTVWVKDQNGCETVDTVVLSEPAPLSNDIQLNSPACYNHHDGKITIHTTGGKRPYTFRLNQEPFQYDSVYTNLNSGSYVITVKDSNSCYKTDTVFIQNPLAVSADYTITPSSCFNGNDGKIVVSPTTGKSPFLYRINQGPAQTEPLFENLTAGAYLVTISDSSLCTYSDSIHVTQPSILTFIKDKKAISCNNANDGSIAFTPGGGTAPYHLLFDSILYPVPSTISSIKPGVYTYYLIDSKNCSVELTDSFENPSQIFAGTISGDSMVLLNTIHTYSVPFQHNLSFAWDLSGGTLLLTSVNPPTATVLWENVGIGQLSLIASSGPNCSDTASLMVSVGATGLQKTDISTGITIFPNPVKNILNIHLQTLPDDKLLHVFDIYGRLLIEQELKLTQQLNIETLMPGIYLLKIGAWSGQMIKEQ